MSSIGGLFPGYISRLPFRRGIRCDGWVQKNMLHVACAFIAFLSVSWNDVSNGVVMDDSSTFSESYAGYGFTDVQLGGRLVGPQTGKTAGNVGSDDWFGTMPTVLAEEFPGKSSAIIRSPGDGIHFLSRTSTERPIFSPFENVIKALDTMMNVHILLTLAHEHAHLEYVIEQGGEVEAFSFNGTGGYVTYSGHINKAGFSAAGIEKEKAMAASYISTLKRGDVAGHMDALFVLYAKSAGLRYVLSSKLGRIDDGNDDLSNYSDATGVDADQVVMGLIADMLLDTDMIPLVKLAAGKESTLKPWGIKFFYNLSKTGPESGIRFSLSY